MFFSGKLTSRELLLAPLVSAAEGTIPFGCCPTRLRLSACSRSLLRREVFDFARLQGHRVEAIRRHKTEKQTTQSRSRHMKVYHFRVRYPSTSILSYHTRGGNRTDQGTPILITSDQKNHNKTQNKADDATSYRIVSDQINLKRGQPGTRGSEQIGSYSGRRIAHLLSSKSTRIRVQRLINVKRQNQNNSEKREQI